MIIVNTTTHIYSYMFELYCLCMPFLSPNALLIFFFNGKGIPNWTSGNTEMHFQKFSTSGPKGAVFPLIETNHFNWKAGCARQNITTWGRKLVKCKKEKPDRVAGIAGAEAVSTSLGGMDKLLGASTLVLLLLPDCELWVGSFDILGKLQGTLQGWGIRLLKSFALFSGS